MSATIGKGAVVTSWAGTFNAAMLALFSPMKFGLVMNGQEMDVTEYGSSLIVQTHQSGLRDWEGNLDGYNATAVQGNVGNVTGTDYAVALDNWNITIGCVPVPTTNWTSLDTGWRSFSPGLLFWTGSYGGFVDSDTAVPAVMEYATSSDASAVFTLSSANTLTGTIRTTSVNIDSEVSGANRVQIGFRGIGQLTSSGSNAVFTAGTLPEMVAGSLVVTAATGRTYTGDAFPSAISVSCRLGETTRMAVRARGAGKLTPA